MWKLITTAALKRLQPFHNTVEVLKSSALSGSATLIIFNQCMKTEVRKGVQKSEMSILSCLRDVNFCCPWDLLVTLVTGSFTSQQIQWHRRIKGIPWPGSCSSWELVMEGGRTDTGRNSLYCNVAGLRKQIWSDMTLSSLQVVAVCPVAAEELYVENILGMQCFFLQIPRVQQQKCRKNRRVGPVCPPLLISEYPRAL